MDQSTHIRTERAINSTQFPTLAILIFSGEFENALKYLQSLNREMLFDTLLYSGLGVIGDYSDWVDNISANLQTACEQGFIVNQPIFDKIKAELN